MTFHVSYQCSNDVAEPVIASRYQRLSTGAQRLRRPIARHQPSLPDALDKILVPDHIWHLGIFWGMLHALLAFRSIFRDISHDSDLLDPWIIINEPCRTVDCKEIHSQDYDIDPNQDLVFWYQWWFCTRQYPHLSRVLYTGDICQAVQSVKTHSKASTDIHMLQNAEFQLIQWLGKSIKIWLARLGFGLVVSKDPRQQSTKVEKSKFQYLSFKKHPKF